MAFFHDKVHTLDARVQFEIKPPQMAPDGLKIQQSLVLLEWYFLIIEFTLFTLGYNLK